MKIFLSAFLFFTQAWFNTLALATPPASCQSNKLLAPGETCCQIDSEVIVKCKAPGAVAAKEKDCQINPDGPTYHQWTCLPAKTGTPLQNKKSMECQKSPQLISSQLVDDTNAIAKKCEELEKESKKEEKNQPLSISLTSEGNYKAEAGHWYLNCKEQSPSTYQRYNLDTYFFADNNDKQSHKEVTDKRTQARTNSFKLTDSPEDRCEKTEKELRAIFEEYKIKFDFPEKVTLNNVPEKIVFKKWKENSIKEVTDWLNEKGEFGKLEDKDVTYLSKGGSSIVFKFKDKNNGGEKVIKVLSEKHPKLSGQKLIDFYRAEMARGESLKQVAERFQVDGKPFLKARTSDLKYAGEGILIQKFIKGANANNIAKSALDNNTNALAEAGFKTNKDAERDLKILESFYQASFGIGDKVTRHFKVDVPNNHFSRTGRFGSPVGYDYNHGNNVIGNKNWVIFDY